MLRRKRTIDLVEPRIAQANAARLGSGEGFLGATRNQASFLLSYRRVDVQHERVDIGAKLRDDERHALGHKATDERDIAAQPIQLRYHDRAPPSLRVIEGRRKLRPAIEGIGTLTGFHLNELGRYS